MSINDKIDNLLNLKYHTINSINSFLLEISTLKKIKNNKKISYFNIPASFDIETTSFKDKDEKVAIMYEWTLGINFSVIVGRTWEEFLYVYDRIVDFLELDIENRLVIYIHNESFEFQFIRKRLKWQKVFSLEKRKPVSALTVDGVEFRCSYVLSGYSLDMLSKQLVKYKVRKMTGFLDYSKKRHSQTPLTNEEWLYCIADVVVVMAYIQETIERVGDITKIPLTKTGYVRNYCRNNCLYDDKSHRKNTDKYHRYRKLMQTLTIEPYEYELLKAAFMGGFTHANPYYSRGIFHNVHSFDFTSSYPAVQLSEKFPMSKGTRVKIEDSETFKYYLNNYCCILKMYFKNIKDILHFENYIPSSKCLSLKKAVENNGRVVSAEYLEIVITEQDYMIIREFYEWEEMGVIDCIAYIKDYLPTDFVKAILQLYVDKTQLKGVEGKEVEYLVSKENLNSCYGMTVTDICREDICYTDGEWSAEEPNISESIHSYNISKRRFLFYPWGIWVTAYARRNLFTGILEFGDDYIYSDTDSLKVQNIENHMEYIKDYNDLITFKLERAFEHHGIDKLLLKVKNNKGVEKPMGIWDYEGCYSRFKTLGAKRYMTEKNGEISITVSGLNKTKAVPYLQDRYKGREFEIFDEDLYIPPAHTGKLTHTYIDTEKMGVIEDYNGVQCRYHELSATHLGECDYSLTLSRKYVDFLLDIQTFEK